MFLKLKYQKVFFKMTNSIIIMTKKNKTVFQYFLIILFLSSPISISSQKLNNSIYYGEDFFIIEGTEISNSLKENIYD